MNDQKRDWLTGGVLFLLLAARACCAGMRYWPQMDDYIQYYSYAHASSFRALAQAEGLLAYRPLAAVLDYFVWGKMFDFMLLGAVLIAAAYAVYIVLTVRLLRRYFSVSPVCPVLMALLPVGVEGIYWMSASTRIVMGLLAGALALSCLARWLDTGSPAWAAMYLVLQLVPFGFYEQPAVLSAAMALGMGILEWKRRGKRCLAALWSAPAAGFYLLYTRLMAPANPFVGRSDMILPLSPYYYRVFLPDLLRQLKAVFWSGNLATLVKGFLRGARMVLRGEAVLWAVAMAALCVLFGFLAAGREADEAERRGNRMLLAIVSGLLMALASISIFFVLSNPYITFRCAVPALTGLALALDSALQFLWRKLRLPGRGLAAAAALMALVCSVAGVSEMVDYRDSYRNDQRAAQAILAAIPQDYPTPESCQGARIGLLGLNATFLPDQNYEYHGHIQGCTESSWATCGLLTCLDRWQRLPDIEPLPVGTMYAAWNAQVRRLDGFDRIYWYDYARNTITPVTLERTGEHDFTLYMGGRLLGRVWEDADAHGYFSLDGP